MAFHCWVCSAMLQARNFKLRTRTEQSQPPLQCKISTQIVAKCHSTLSSKVSASRVAVNVAARNFIVSQRGMFRMKFYTLQSDCTAHDPPSWLWDKKKSQKSQSLEGLINFKVSHRRRVGSPCYAMIFIPLRSWAALARSRSSAQIP